MTKERFEEIITNLKLEKNKWITLGEIESIIFSDGTGIYPNWKHIRFLITDGNEILVRHGDSEPYGARLNYIFSLSTDGCSLSFPPGNVVAQSEYYSNFRIPKSGDIIRSTIGTEKCLSESIVSSVLNAGNMCLISTINPIVMNKESRLSFYDPSEYDADICMHSTESEGIYMKFHPNCNGKKDKKFGIYHDIIKIKNIAEINLKLFVKLKTYKLV